jgi:sulfur carrier protein ThiS
MTISLALFAYLSAYQPGGQGGRYSRLLEFAEGTTIAAVIASLGLPDGPRVVFVNGKHAPDEYVLVEGDRLAIFPPVAGG